MKFTKNMKKPYGFLLSATIIMGLLGLALTAAGWTMGGSRSGYFNFSDTVDSGFADVSSLKADIGVGSVRVLQGDGYSVRAVGVDAKSYACAVDGDVLKVNYKHRSSVSAWPFIRDRYDPVIVITLPPDAVAEVSVGVGKIELDDVDFISFTGSVDVGEIEGKFPFAQDECRLRTSVGIGNLWVPSRHREGFDLFYSQDNAAVNRQLSLSVDVGSVYTNFADSALAGDDDGESGRHKFSDEAGVSGYVGFTFTAPFALPDDFGEVSYSAYSDSDIYVGQAEWPIENGRVTYRMSDGYPPYFNDYDGADEMTVLREYDIYVRDLDVECLELGIGRFIARWADGGHWFDIVSGRTLAPEELEMIVESVIYFE